MNLIISLSYNGHHLGSEERIVEPDPNNNAQVTINLGETLRFQIAPEIIKAIEDRIASRRKLLAIQPTQDSPPHPQTPHPKP